MPPLGLQDPLADLVARQDALEAAFAVMLDDEHGEELLRVMAARAERMPEPQGWALATLVAYFSSQLTQDAPRPPPPDLRVIRGGAA